MTTTPIALGQHAKLAFAVQSAVATPAASGYRYAFYYSSTLRETKPIATDPFIGAGFHNPRDPTPPAPAPGDHGGAIAVPVCLNGIGDWLRLVFGAPATSGAVNYTHVFASGGPAVPANTIEFNPIASDFRQHVGLAARALRFDFAGVAGYQRAELDLLGFGENLLGATGAGAPLAARPYDPLKATGAAVFLAGVQVGVLLSAKIAYETGVVQDRYFDGSDSFGVAMLAEQSALTGELRLRYTSPALDLSAIAETDQALEIRMIKSAHNALVLATPAARLGRAGVALQGPGGVEQTVPFRCAQTVSAPMFTATLQNQVASYA